MSLYDRGILDGMTVAYTNPLSGKIEELQHEIKRVRNEKYELEKSKNIVDLPERYIINDGATILFWKNGKKTVVKRAEDDEFNPRLAFLTAFFQHYCGMSKNKANKYLASLKVEKKPEIEKEEPVEKPKRGRPRKNTSKFKVGDKIIGNKLADTKYAITRTGWKGIVTEVKNGYFFARNATEKYGTEFPLKFECFDKYEEDK